MLLIGNGRVVTGNQEQPLIEDGSVVLDGNTVLEVGNYRDLKEKYADATFVDAKGGLIMPAVSTSSNYCPRFIIYISKVYKCFVFIYSIC